MQHTSEHILYGLQALAVAHFFVDRVLNPEEKLCALAYVASYGYDNEHSQGSITFTVDTGATRHCVGSKTGLTGFKPFDAWLRWQIPADWLPSQETSSWRCLLSASYC